MKRFKLTGWIRRSLATQGIFPVPIVFAAVLLAPLSAFAQGPVPVLVSDINKDSALSSDSDPEDFFQIGAITFFTADDGINGRELWRTDGMPAGTMFLADINAIPSSPTDIRNSNPATFQDLNGVLFFVAATPATGLELWRADGTPGGVELFLDLLPGRNPSIPFSVQDGRLTEIQVVELTPGVGTLFFSASDGGPFGIELWMTDGTREGTVLVKDISTGQPSSAPDELAAVGDRLFFSATTPDASRELWSSDGTPGGTEMVAEIRLGGGRAEISQITDLDGVAFFRANNGLGIELWKSDGTAGGTAMVLNINTGIGGANSTPMELTPFQGRLYFTADSGAANGRELWMHDPAMDATAMVVDVMTGGDSSDPAELTVAGGDLYFAATSAAEGRQIWKVDGTTFAATRATGINAAMGGADARSLAPLGGDLLFSADASTGPELWMIDGGTGDVSQVKEIVPGSDGFDIQGGVEFEGHAFFPATDSVNGVELWKSDGSEMNTVQVADINPMGDASPLELTVMNGTLFFTADDGASGRELWSLTGAGGAPSMVAEIRSGTGDPTIENLTVFDGALYFTANSGAGGIEMWRTDGSDAGTFQLQDISPGGGSSSPDDLAVSQGRLFFSADDGVHGRELFALNFAPEASVFDGATPVPDGGAIDLGAIAVTGAPTDLTLTVRNTGAEDLRTSPVLATGGITVLEGLASVIPPDGSDTFTLLLPTDVAGALAGTVSFATNDADENPYDFTISGTVGGEPEIAVDIGGVDVPDGSGPIDLGTFNVGDPPIEVTVNVANIGSSVLTVASIDVPLGVLITEFLDMMIPAGASDSFTFLIANDVAGVFMGTVTITSDDADEAVFDFTIVATVIGGGPVPPVIDALPDDTAIQGTPYTSAAPVLLAGTGPVTWQLIVGPAGMTIDEATGVVSWLDPLAAGSPHGVTIRATNAAGSVMGSFSLTVLAPPLITLQLADVVAEQGAAATFTVEAAGTPPITYQWRFNGLPISGATAASFTIDPVEIGDDGAYDVVITDAVGSVTSDLAVLVIPADTMLDFAADGGGDRGWTGFTPDGFGGSVIVDDRGICLSVPLEGQNLPTWVSPESLIGLTAGTVYRVRVALTTDQSGPGAIPLLVLSYDNFDRDTGFLNVGGERWVWDANGGANGIGRPGGRSSFDFYIGPVSMALPQWNGDVDPEGGAFTPEADPLNDLRLSLRVIDLTLDVNGDGTIDPDAGDADPLMAIEDGGTICISDIEITAVLLDDLMAGAFDVYSPPLHDGDPGAGEDPASLDRTHFPQSTVNAAAYPTVSADIVNGRWEVAMPVIDEASDPGMTGALRATLGPDVVAAGEIVINDPNGGGAGVAADVLNPLRLYPIMWDRDGVYVIRAGIVSGEAAEGTNPVDVISLTFEAYGAELGGSDFVTSGNGGLAGGMHLAGSPRLASTTGGVTPDLVSVFAGNNVTASLVANAARFKANADLFNRSDLGGGPASGTDRLAIESLRVYRTGAGIVSND